MDTLPEIHYQAKRRSFRDVNSNAQTISVISEHCFLREIVHHLLSIKSTNNIISFKGVTEFKHDAPIDGNIVVVVYLRTDTAPCATMLDELLEFDTNIPIIVLAAPRPSLLNVAITHGAKGYVPFTENCEVLLESINVLSAGGTYAPLSFLAKFSACEGTQYTDQREASMGLTSREVAVIKAIKQGKSNKTIAYALNMAESTVKSHVKSIMIKLRVRTRTEIALISSDALYQLSDRDVFGDFNLPQSA